jgi:hypothetical protein
LSLRLNQLLVLHFSGPFPSDRIPTATMDGNVHFFTVAITVNYSSKFL